MEKYSYINYFNTVMAWCMQERDLLKDAISNLEDIDIDRYYRMIHDVEKNADVLRREMIRELLHDFIPLFEREDILELSKLIENVIDSIETIFQLIKIYNIRYVDKNIIALMDILSHEIDAIASVIDELENIKTSKKVNELIESAMNIETMGDEMYMNALTDLFKKAEGNIFNALPKKELIQAFEDAINACEQVAYFVEVIQINNL